MTAMFKESWQILASLVVGLGITLRQMLVKPFTVQYPDERVIWPARTRGRLVLPRNPDNQAHRCTACLMCERICPNGSIEITVTTNEIGKRVLQDYLHHLDRCTFCGLCVETCAFDALRMSHEHEIASRNKGDFKRHLQLEAVALKTEWQGGLPDKAENRKSRIENREPKTETKTENKTE